MGIKASFVCVVLWSASVLGAGPQATVGSGTIEVTVTDPTGAVIVGATVDVSAPVSGYHKTIVTNSVGVARLNGVPLHHYHVSVSLDGFQTAQRDVDVNSAVPMTLTVQLQLASSASSVEVHSDSKDILENVPTAHTDLDSSLIDKLPMQNVGQGISDAISLAVPGVVQDSNGFFHPLGDHAEVQFSIDNQPVGDQQNKQATNQLPLNVIQSFEAIAGAPPPEYGDKASLVVSTVTKTGLGAKPFGSLTLGYGSFGTADENFTFGSGTSRFGNFISADTARSGHYLDAPEFGVLHDVGNNEAVFDRVDFQAGPNDTIHLNLFGARSWFQIPNTYPQQDAGQDQRQQIYTVNIAPGWVHLLAPSLVLTFNPFVREDHVQYFPSRNPFDDLPATISQNRRLLNTGAKTDLSWLHGIHNIKTGVQVMHDILDEAFNLGITDPTFNAPCLVANLLPLVGSCPAGTAPNNSNFQPGLAPYDLTRGGRLFLFHGHTDIKEYGFFAQDTISIAGFTLMGGLRGDIYRGLSQDSAIEPRLGASYLIKPSSTVLRLSYSRFFETPYNENLILSSSTGVGGLANTFGAFGQKPLTSGRRNQYQAGVQQGFGKYVVIDSSYFWKYTNNAFDFDNLFNTPIAFPVEWRKSKVDGVSVRVNMTNIKGFTAYTVLGHTRARFFGPEAGGLLFNSPVDTGVFRIDHDEALEQTTNLRWQYKRDGPWVSFTWRYDSGLVAGSVPNLAAALALSGDEQQAIGFFCGNTSATLNSPITSCSGQPYGATRLRIPAAGTENDDTNPPRIAPRNLFDVGVGTDNLFHTDRVKWTVALTGVNITNDEVLYNFLSTFSGTHFVSPRALRIELGMKF